MRNAVRIGKTISFTGFLLGCLGMIFPFLRDYRGYNGMECALLFLNADESRPLFFLLTAFFFASGLGLIFSLKRDHWLFFALPALAAASAGIWLFSIFGFRLYPFGWAAFGGSILQAAGGAILAFASRRRP